MVCVALFFVWTDYHNPLGSLYLRLALRCPYNRLLALGSGDRRSARFHDDDPAILNFFANFPLLIATSNDPWGPTGTDMSEIAAMTFGR